MLRMDGKCEGQIVNFDFALPGPVETYRLHAHTEGREKSVDLFFSREEAQALLNQMQRVIVKDNPPKNPTFYQELAARVSKTR